MLRIKPEVDLKELEKFGFKKHKHDDKEVVLSKWSREWVEADCIDGYPCGSSGWDFYPVIELVKVYNNTLKLKVKGNYYYAFEKPNGIDLLFDLIQAGLVEKVSE